MERPASSLKIVVQTKQPIRFQCNIIHSHSLPTPMERTTSSPKIVVQAKQPIHFHYKSGIKWFHLAKRMHQTPAKISILEFWKTSQCHGILQKP